MPRVARTEWWINNDVAGKNKQQRVAMMAAVDTCLVMVLSVERDLFCCAVKTLGPKQ